jgi:hypothetical protein
VPGTFRVTLAAAALTFELRARPERDLAVALEYDVDLLLDE